MVPTSPLATAAFSRRTLLAASAAGLGVLLVGCTSDDGTAPVTEQQADELAGQVGAHAALVAAFTAAAAADPALGTEVADLTTQVQQLERLQAAAPGPSSSASPTSAAAPPAPDTRAWLRTQVATTADSHATACVDQTGARAALLGSIAAGLRGMDARLA